MTPALKMFFWAITAPGGWQHGIWIENNKSKLADGVWDLYSTTGPVETFIEYLFLYTTFKTLDKEVDIKKLAEVNILRVSFLKQWDALLQLQYP